MRYRHRYITDTIRNDEEWYQAEGLIQQLASMEWDKSKEEKSQLEVVEMFRGVKRKIFWCLDDLPGKWGWDRDGREWHWKLRRARNGQKKLFQVLV